MVWQLLRLRRIKSWIAARDASKKMLVQKRHTMYIRPVSSHTTTPSVFRVEPGWKQQKDQEDRTIMYLHDYKLQRWWSIQWCSHDLVRPHQLHEFAFFFDPNFETSPFSSICTNTSMHHAIIPDPESSDIFPTRIPETSSASHLTMSPFTSPRLQCVRLNSRYAHTWHSHKHD